MVFTAGGDSVIHAVKMKTYLIVITGDEHFSFACPIWAKDMRDAITKADAMKISLLHLPNVITQSLTLTAIMQK